MTTDTKLWGKEFLIPSILFIICFYILLSTSNLLGLPQSDDTHNQTMVDTDTVANDSAYLPFFKLPANLKEEPVLFFFVTFILFLITSNLKYGHKIRKRLLNNIYRSEDQKLRRALDRVKEKSPIYLYEKEKPLTYLYDRKLDQHMRYEIDKLDSRVLLYSNLVLISTLLMLLTIISLLSLFLVQTKPSNLQTIAIDMVILAGMFFICRISIDNWKTSLEEITKVYVQAMGDDTNDFT
ncbi:MAG: hypothetical protein U9N62_03820 [Thermotogota bacterium]|nr:hypothetical protein [Thermotogota bacterium]